MNAIARPPLTPLARAIHWSMAAGLLLTVLAAGRWLGAHAALGVLAGLALVVWIGWYAFFRRHLPPANAVARYLPPAMTVVFLLVLLLGVVAYGGLYGSGPLGVLLEGWGQLGNAARAVHGPMAVVLLALVGVHAIVAGVAKLRARRAVVE